MVPGGFALPIEESSSPSTPTTFGIYRVLHQSGSGVLGPVFRAFDLRHDRVVAVKAFELSPVADRITSVADALRRLSAGVAPDSAVVLPFDAGIEGTTPFIVMAHQPGDTLDVVIRLLAPAPPEHVLPILARLADALDAAAAAGLEHGALHPRDVFVTDGQVAVVGFGVVRALEAAGVETPMRRPYSAPERATGAWDRRADLYSFGVIAHEFLTGRRPLGPGEQDGEFAADLAPERRVRLRRALADVLAGSPADRYPTARAFVAALEHAGLGSAARLSTIADAPADASGDFWAAHHDRPDEAPGEPVETRPSSEPAPRGAVEEALPDWIIPPVAAPTATPRRTRRWSSVAGLAAFGLLGALGGHLAVRALRPLPAVRSGASSVAAVPAPDAGVDQTDVVVADASGSPIAPAGDVQVVSAASAGRLWIRSVPSGALVTIDGRRSGQTPALVSAGFGTHLVQVARSGYTPRVAQVTLGAETPEQELSFSLRPGVPAASTTVGGLDIGSRPRGARVLVDGRFLGRAPLRVPQLKPGTYTVTLELAGYQPYTGQASVSAGTLTSLRPMLRSTSR
ncbi:MAG: PEGA domain-containing protein [Acidobacteria bacterium]|nr:PEGA domain-containing protein [Acidobacteriota bacterium]